MSNGCGYSWSCRRGNCSHHDTLHDPAVGSDVEKPQALIDVIYNKPTSQVHCIVSLLVKLLSTYEYHISAVFEEEKGEREKGRETCMLLCAQKVPTLNKETAILHFQSSKLPVITFALYNTEQFGLHRLPPSSDSVDGIWKSLCPGQFSSVSTYYSDLCPKLDRVSTPIALQSVWTRCLNVLPLSPLSVNLRLLALSARARMVRE